MLKRDLQNKIKELLGIAHEELKPIIIVMNKWDLVENKNNTTMKKMKERIVC